MLVAIDNVKKEDFEQIHKIYDFYVKNSIATFDCATPSVDQMIDKWKKSPDLPYFVARFNNKIIGYAYAAPYRERFAYRFTVEDSIYIHPDYIKQSLGPKLLKLVIDDCRKKNYQQMIAVIAGSKEEAIGSIKLHNKFGFKEQCRLEKVGFKFDKYIDTTIMQLNLQ